jgi:peptidyl-prolyl cis-trans isomerase D
MGMMGWMRHTSRYFLAAVVIAFVASLAYIGATKDGTAPEWVVSVNGEAVSAVTYQRAYRTLVEQYRQVFRDRFTDDMAKSLRLQEQVLERLVTEQLVAQRAAAEGLRISDEELAAEITRIGAFQEGGRFSRARYLQLLTRAQLTPAAFEQDVRSDLLRRKVQALIQDGVKASEAEVRQHWEGERQRVRVAYLVVSPEAGPGGAPPDAELEAYHKAHAAEFTQPERRRVLVALLPGSSVPLPAVTDAQAAAAYQERRSEFEQPPRARVSHILVRVPSTGGSQAEDQAKAKAEAARERIRGGADFAQVAREVSEDTTTAPKGGELGLVGPGELVPEFDKVVSGLKKGEVAGPVRTPFGYHVIKVTELGPGTKRELKEVATTLKATLAAEGQLRALRDKAVELQRALLGARDFAAEARRQGLGVREVGPLGRTDPVEGIGRVGEATEAIFGLAAGGVSAPVKVPEGYAVFRLVDQQPARSLPLAEARADVARAVGRQKAREAAEAKARQLAEAWRNGEDPRGLAKRGGVAFGEAGPFSRAEPLADRDLAQAIGSVALGLADGGIGGPAPGPRGLYVVKTVGRERPDPAEFEKARRDAETRLLQQKRGQVWQAWLAGLRTGAKVEVNRKVLPES